ncbi:MAG: hypothetical protein PHY16_08040 [Methylobacter sp.]|nr:hypothetical protein [Methylobacter sp.]
MTKGSYQQELDNFFNLANPDNPPAQVVTKSALSQARKQLSHTAFIDLNRQAVNAYYAAHPELGAVNGSKPGMASGFAPLTAPSSESLTSLISLPLFGRV